MAVLTKQHRGDATAPQIEISAVAFSTELGWMLLLWERERLHGLRFGFLTQRDALSGLGNSKLIKEASVPESVRGWIKRLRDFASGRFAAVNAISLDLSHMTEFQQRVVTICRTIPAGETISYGQLATLAGVPGGARAVGNVMRTNRFPLIVPCHRVIGSNGRLCGFTSPQGISMKERLLQMEKSAKR